MKCVVGLGNPGKEYQNTRHNSGFMMVDFLRKKADFSEFKFSSKFESMISEGKIDGEKIYLLKPQTFMNNSGIAVKKIGQFYAIDSKNLLIIYDDIDLPLGTLRYRDKGSAGSHNGMKSVVDELRDNQFPRLRIGIENRSSEHKKLIDIASYVLSPFSQEEKSNVERSFKEALLLLNLHFFNLS